MFKFEPNEQAKAMIEASFKEKNEKQTTNIVPGQRHRLKIPEPPSQSAEQEKESVQMAQKECNELATAFLSFCHEIEGKIISEYLRGQLNDMASSIDDMESLLFEEPDKSKLTSEGLPYYEKMRKVRGIILNDVYDKYKKGK